jgi:hypothetical protein
VVLLDEPAAGLRDDEVDALRRTILGVHDRFGAVTLLIAKHAQVGLMRCLAKELAPRGIRVNTIHPGPIDNAFQLAVEHDLQGLVGRDGTQFFNQMIPAGPPRHRRRDRALGALPGLGAEQLHDRRAARR